MRDLNLSVIQTITGMLLPMQVILIRKIPSVKGPAAFEAKEASFQERFCEERHIFQLFLPKEVLECSRVNFLDLGFQDI